MNAIKEIVEGSDYEEIILIGDNGQHDVGAYKAITDLYPTKKITSYIHEVYNPYDKELKKKGVSLATGQVPYFTASDLGLEFLLKGLITEKQFIAIAKKVSQYISSNDPDIYEQVIPSWSRCRQFISTYQRPNVEISKETILILNTIESRMKRLCR